nr:hypothetical protein [uncultured Draconibacterium sp.]
MSLNAFKSDCLKLQHDDVVQKYLLDGSSYFFDKEINTDEFRFKKDIAQCLNVHLREIVIVGSGKLGFSIKPDRDVPGYFPFKEFDHDFKSGTKSKKSDLDIAIVSNALFDNQLHQLFDYTSQYCNNEIWDKRTDRNSLAKYILKGWLKPEFVPKLYKISDDLHAILAKYKMEFGRDVNIGIYKTWYFFEKYHINNIRNINLNLIANGKSANNKT